MRFIDNRDTRIKKFFSFFPVRLRKGNETRWLELVIVKQKYMRYFFESHKWINEEFLN